VRAYPDRFYRRRQEGSVRSAREILPFVLEAVRPHSVVDVGCGTGDWLAVCQDLGVADVFGLDGDWVSRSQLRVPPDRFAPVDLQLPVRMPRSFDLVLSLEVAEHLPKSCAGDFIASLTGLGPVVLFSAAVPFQGGACHLNEQWPNYWAEHFARRGFVPVDCLRARFWENPHVCWWYAQNALVWVRETRLTDYPTLQHAYDSSCPPRALVHPCKYLDVADPASLSLRRLWSLVSGKVRGAVERRLGTARMSRAA
jgi:SAM-dependent methyltransferase